MLGGWTGSWAPDDKKSSKWSTRCISLHDATTTECDKKKKTNKTKQNKKGVPVTEIWIHVLDREINIFYKFHVKIMFWSKALVHEIRGTNFWDTLYLMQWNLQESNVLPDNFFSWAKKGHDFVKFSSFLKYIFSHKLVVFCCFCQQFFTLYCLWVFIIPFLNQKQAKTEPEV